jgi:hypothetical protein
VWVVPPPTLVWGYSDLLAKLLDISQNNPPYSNAKRLNTLMIESLSSGKKLKMK